MFGFNLLTSDVLKLPFQMRKEMELFSKEFFEDLYGFNKDKELEEAELINVHTYTVDNLTYEQKVYRLKDNSIFVETKNIKDTEIDKLQLEQDKAVAEQRFEDAAKLRDQIAALRKK